MNDILIFLAGVLFGVILTSFITSRLSRLSGDLFVDVKDNNYMYLSLSRKPHEIINSNTVKFKVKVLKDRS